MAKKKNNIWIIIIIVGLILFSLSANKTQNPYQPGENCARLVTSTGVLLQDTCQLVDVSKECIPTGREAKILASSVFFGVCE